MLADELNASVTPVRDALHRLTGERLVEAPRHEGFRVPMITETMLRHLYAWHLDLLLLAVMKHRAADVPHKIIESDGAIGLPTQARDNALFLGLVRSAGNPEHYAALEVRYAKARTGSALRRDIPRRDRSRYRGDCSSNSSA